jgi:RNA polymerase sigma factor (sigma-70 family)
VRLSRRLRRVIATRPIVYWSLTLALAAGTVAVVQRATTDAEDARRRWGETRPTLVATRPVAVGDALGPTNAAVRDVPVALRPDGALDTLPDPAPPPDEATAHAMRLTRLIEAVRSLPENLKAVASLYLEEMPIKEIALALGISESNTSVRLHRAKSAIKLSFGDPS